MATELKPCPFCGTKPAQDHHANPNVWCADEKCTISGVVFSGGPRHWNERAADSSAAVAEVGLFYIQDTRSFVGNCPMWWGPDGNGYVTRLDEAGRYTLEDALGQHRVSKTDVPWPCAEIDALGRLTVDHQHMRPRAAQLAAVRALQAQQEEAP